jgi:hypothetical protein
MYLGSKQWAISAIMGYHLEKIAMVGIPAW